MVGDHPDPDLDAEWANGELVPVASPPSHHDAENDEGTGDPSEQPAALLAERTAWPPPSSAKLPSIGANVWPCV